MSLRSCCAYILMTHITNTNEGKKTIFLPPLNRLFFFLSSSYIYPKAWLSGTAYLSLKKVISIKPFRGHWSLLGIVTLGVLIGIKTSPSIRYTIKNIVFSFNMRYIALNVFLTLCEWFPKSYPHKPTLFFHYCSIHQKAVKFILSANTILCHTLFIYEYVAVKNLKYSIIFFLCLLTINFLITILFVFTRLLFFVCPEGIQF
jgi:hypothetical protein